MRRNVPRSIIMVAAVLLLTTVVIVLPRIIEAKRLNALSADRNLALASALTNPGQASQDQTGNIQVTESYQNDTSKPLRDMKPQPVFSKGEHEANKNPKIPHRHIDSPDPVVQGSFSDMKALITPNMPAPILNFNGIPFPGVACNCAPPDTNGEVGATQY